MTWDRGKPARAASAMLRAGAWKALRSCLALEIGACTSSQTCLESCCVQVPQAPWMPMHSTHCGPSISKMCEVNSLSSAARLQQCSSGYLLPLSLCGRAHHDTQTPALAASSRHFPNTSSQAQTATRPAAPCRSHLPPSAPSLMAPRHAQAPMSQGLHSPTANSSASAIASLHSPWQSPALTPTQASLSPVLQLRLPLPQPPPPLPLPARRTLPPPGPLPTAV